MIWNAVYLFFLYIQGMVEKVFTTPNGDIHYWVSEEVRPGALSLIFLPGLTADHRLFDKQIEFFESRYNVFVWDAPGHASSWPFHMNFHLMDKANWLEQILAHEHLENLVFVGQSMGGYVAQTFMQMYPDRLKGFVSVDSCPMQRKYITGLELFLLRFMEPVYRWYPWAKLLKAGSEGVATTEYGRKLMLDMMMIYDGNQDRYAKLAGHGYRMLADGIAANLPYEIRCPALLICGEKDAAGSAKRYNKAWHKKTGIPLEWIKGAGHNSNTDAPEVVNKLIQSFVDSLQLDDFEEVQFAARVTKKFEAI